MKHQWNKIILVLLGFSGIACAPNELQVSQTETEEKNYFQMGLKADNDGESQAFKSQQSYRPQSGASNSSENYLSQVSIKEYLGQDRQMDKPMFIVEGFDPLNQYDNSFMYNNLPSKIKLYAYYSSRDIVMVNFKNGGAKIQDNAKALEAVLNLYRKDKKISHSFVVVGFSMGGVVARWALRSMELAGKDHNTSVFISYDSPHYGANLQRGIYDSLRSIKKNIKKVSLGFSKNKEIAEYLKLFESPAAKQLLVWGSDFNQFYNQLEVLGMPKRSYNVGLASGSGYGRSQGIQRPSSLLDFRLRLKNGLWSESTRKNIRAQRSPACSFPCHPAHRFYDNAPGSTIDSVKQFSDKMEKIGRTNSKASYRKYAGSLATTSFIPTTSALGIRNVSLNLNINSNKNDVMKLTIFDEIIYNVKNKAHAPPFIALLSDDNFQNIAFAIGKFHRRNPSGFNRVSKQNYLSRPSRMRGERLSGSSVELSWANVSGATNYAVYRVDNSVYTRVKTVHSTRAILSNSSRRAQTYAVVACKTIHCSHPSAIRVSGGGPDRQIK